MRNNKLVKFTTFVLLITIIAICLVSGTFAKYTTTVTGEATATVAKWEIEVKDGETAVSGETVEFSLFDTINDTDATNKETDVAEGKIAPGTSGSFKLTVANKSEVNAEYAIDYTVTKTANIPIKFSVDGGQSWTEDLADVTGTLDMIDGETIDNEEITVQWMWAFEELNDGVANTAVDAADTTIGELATPATVTVAATITVDQVD